MSEREEDLQKRIEQGDHVENDLDAAAYSKLFSVIGNEPSINLSKNFAERISSMILLKKKKEARRDFLWLSFGVVFLVVGLIVTAALAGLTMQLGFLLEISAYAGVFIFGIVMIIAFNWLEKRTISNRFS
jgi:divalent metal cation (Fe/Co/Zn/Cd) transporter